MLRRNTIPITEVHDQSIIASRYGVGSVFVRNSTLTGSSFLFKCDHVEAILGFYTDEDSSRIDRTDFNYAKDFSNYQDGFIVRDDLAAFDALLVNMFLTGENCTTLQGGISA